MKVMLVMSLLGRSHYLNRVDYGTDHKCVSVRVRFFCKTLDITYAFLLQNTALCKSNANNRFYSEMLVIAAFLRPMQEPGACVNRARVYVRELFVVFTGVGCSSGEGGGAGEEIGGRCVGGEESISGSRGKHRARHYPLRHFPSFPLNCFFFNPLQARDASRSRTAVHSSFGLFESLVAAKAVLASACCFKRSL